MGNENISGYIIGGLILVVLLGVIGTFLRAEPIQDCFDDAYPYLNASDSLCYNSTVGDLGSTESTRISMSVTESLIAGLIIIILAIGFIMSVFKKKPVA